MSRKPKRKNQRHSRSKGIRVSSVSAGRGFSAGTPQGEPRAVTYKISKNEGAEPNHEITNEEKGQNKPPKKPGADWGLLGGIIAHLIAWSWLLSVGVGMVMAIILGAIIGVVGVIIARGFTSADIHGIF